MADIPHECDTVDPNCGYNPCIAWQERVGDAVELLVANGLLQCPTCGQEL